MSTLSLVAAAALLSLHVGPVPSSAPPVGAAECPESEVGQVGSLQWFLVNPEHGPDRAASGLRDGLRAFDRTPEGDGWLYVDAEPLADPYLCERVAAAVEAVRLERPDDWMWGFFRVDTRIVAVHERSRVIIDGPGPRATFYVLDPDVLVTDPDNAVVGRFEAERWMAAEPR